MVLRRSLAEFLKNRLDHCRSELFRCQSIAAADHSRARRQFWPAFLQSRDDINIERFANATRLFGAIKDGNRLHGFRQSIYEMFHRKWTVEPDLQHAISTSVLAQMLDRLL